MKILFVTPPMGNWAPWGDRHLAVNSLHAQLAAFIREKQAAEVEVLDCRALACDDDRHVGRGQTQETRCGFLRQYDPGGRRRRSVKSISRGHAED